MNAMPTINTRTSDKNQQKPGDGEIAEDAKVDKETELKIRSGVNADGDEASGSSKPD